MLCFQILSPKLHTLWYVVDILPDSNVQNMKAETETVFGLPVGFIFPLLSTECGEVHNIETNKQLCFHLERDRTRRFLVDGRNE